MILCSILSFFAGLRPQEYHKMLLDECEPKGSLNSSFESSRDTQSYMLEWTSLEILRSSSVVERSAVNRLVAGSNPARRAIYLLDNKISKLHRVLLEDSLFKLSLVFSRRPYV